MTKSCLWGRNFGFCGGFVVVVVDDFILVEEPFIKIALLSGFLESSV